MMNIIRKSIYSETNLYEFPVSVVVHEMNQTMNTYKLRELRNQLSADYKQTNHFKVKPNAPAVPNPISSCSGTDAETHFQR